MKNLFSFSVICSLLFLFAISSCKSDYTCSCDVDGQTFETPFVDAKKGDAEDACEAIEATYTSNGFPNASCTLD